jgi:general secretion pathway protein H
MRIDWSAKCGINLLFLTFRNPQSAFTLVELLIVLAILGLTAAVVVPALPRLVPDDPLTQSTGEVVGLLREARGAALERAAPVTVTLDPATGRYWTGDTSAVLHLAEGVTLSADTNRVSFTFTATGPAHGPVVLVRAPDGARQVGVDRWTGAVHVR